jgi:hypothetical protein
MSSSAARYSSRSMQTSNTSRLKAVLTRAPLAGITFVLSMISLRYFIHPVEAASAIGIHITSPGGLTVARITFAGFPLAFAFVFAICMFSQQRILDGLRMELLLLAIIMAVRLMGMFIGHSTETANLLVPEFGMATLSIVATRIEMNRRKG